MIKLLQIYLYVHTLILIMMFLDFILMKRHQAKSSLVERKIFGL